MMRSRLSLTCAAATAAALALSSPLCRGAVADGVARGVVVHDRDGDGRRSAGEPGIPGVNVSNGRDVVVTDADGGYELPVTDDTIVFVIKPGGWMTPVDENNLPRFYFIHKPAGSPDGEFIYKGVAPTGPLPGSIDFALTPREEPERFRVVAFGDTQPYTIREVDFLAQDVIPELVGVEALFGVTLGDVVGDDLSLFEPIDTVQGRVGIPWYNVLGNHNMNYMSPDDEHSDETFERVYGPPTYAFEVASTHFIVLDDVIWRGFNGLRKNGKPVTNNYHGGLRDDQLDFIENALRGVPTDRLVVLMMHIPLNDGEFPGRQRLFEILSRFERTFSSRRIPTSRSTSSSTPAPGTWASARTTTSTTSRRAGAGGAGRPTSRGSPTPRCAAARPTGTR